VLLLCSLGILSHESGALAGMLLTIAHAYRSGPQQWRSWALRRDTIAVFVLCVGYLLFRSFGTTAMVGPSAIPANLRYLFGSVIETLLAGGGIPCAAAALVLGLRSKHDALSWWRLMLVVAWAVCAYLLFL